MVLFVNACVRKVSRTKRLSDRLLKNLNEPCTEVKLEETEFPLTDAAFLKKRDELIKNREFDAPVFSLARQFAKADTIVIGAPYWDLSFPAQLKQYFEHINVLGITFEYTDDGYPRGLCRAEKLYYVMTAGGSFCPEEYGYGYVKSLAENFYGIKETILISAKELDITGADTEGIMKEAEEKLDLMFGSHA